MRDKSIIAMVRQLCCKRYGVDETKGHFLGERDFEFYHLAFAIPHGGDAFRITDEAIKEAGCRRKLKKIIRNLLPGYER